MLNNLVPSQTPSMHLWLVGAHGVVFCDFVGYDDIEGFTRVLKYGVYI